MKNLDSIILYILYYTFLFYQIYKGLPLRDYESHCYKLGLMSFILENIY